MRYGVLTEQSQLTVSRLIERCDHLEKHRLTSTILADEPEDLPRSHIETYVLKSYDILILRPSQ